MLEKIKRNFGFGCMRLQNVILKHKTSNSRNSKSGLPQFVRTAQKTPMVVYIKV